MDIGIGPIHTTFSGKVRIAERDEPNSYQLRVEGNSRHGWMNGTGRVELEEATAESTLVKANGDLASRRDDRARRTENAARHLQADDAEVLPERRTARG